MNVLEALNDSLVLFSKNNFTLSKSTEFLSLSERRNLFNKLAS
jgi:hypothetical protein